MTTSLPANVLICNEKDVNQGTFVKAAEKEPNVWCMLFKNSATHTRYFIYFDVKQDKILTASTKSPKFNDGCALAPSQLQSVTDTVRDVLTKEMVSQALFGK